MAVSSLNVLKSSVGNKNDLIHQINKNKKAILNKGEVRYTHCSQESRNQSGNIFKNLI